MKQQGNCLRILTRQLSKQLFETLIYQMMETMSVHPGIRLQFASVRHQSTKMKSGY